MAIHERAFEAEQTDLVAEVSRIWSATVARLPEARKRIRAAAEAQIERETEQRRAKAARAIYSAWAQGVSKSALRKVTTSDHHDFEAYITLGRQHDTPDSIPVKATTASLILHVQRVWEETVAELAALRKRIRDEAEKQVAGEETRCRDEAASAIYGAWSRGVSKTALRKVTTSDHYGFEKHLQHGQSLAHDATTQDSLNLPALTQEVGEMNRPRVETRTMTRAEALDHVSRVWRRTVDKIPDVKARIRAEAEKRIALEIESLRVEAARAVREAREHGVRKKALRAVTSSEYEDFEEIFIMSENMVPSFGHHGLLGGDNQPPFNLAPSALLDNP